MFKARAASTIGLHASYINHYTRIVVNNTCDFMNAFIPHPDGRVASAGMDSSVLLMQCARPR
jgi:hypothetical protein